MEVTQQVRAQFVVARPHGRSHGAPEPEEGHGCVLRLHQVIFPGRCHRTCPSVELGSLCSCPHGASFIAGSHAHARRGRHQQISEPFQRPSTSGMGCRSVCRQSRPVPSRPVIMKIVRNEQSRPDRSFRPRGRGIYVRKGHGNGIFGCHSEEHSQEECCRAGRNWLLW
jgi:hypothetical protein